MPAERSRSDHQEDTSLTEVRRLSEHVAAQVRAYEVLSDAYEKYSQALGNIVLMVKQLSDSVSAMDDHSKDDLAEVMQSLAVLSEQMRLQHEASCRELNAVFVEKMSDVVNMTDELKAVHGTVDAIEASMTKMVSSIESVNSNFFKQKSERSKRADKLKTLFAILSAVVTVMAMLEQFGIVHIQFFPAK